MSKNESDWKSTAESVLEDQTSAFDTMRGRCPVAHDGATGWTLFNYRDVLRVAEDAEGFSKHRLHSRFSTQRHGSPCPRKVSSSYRLVL